MQHPAPLLHLVLHTHTAYVRRRSSLVRNLVRKYDTSRDGVLSFDEFSVMGARDESVSRSRDAPSG